MNIYQSQDSGSSSNSDSSSDSSDSDSGTSNSPGSNGGANSAIEPNKTNVINKNITGEDITHGNIQDSDKAKELFKNQTGKHIKGCKE